MSYKYDDIEKSGMWKSEAFSTGKKFNQFKAIGGEDLHRPSFRDEVADR